VVGENAYNRADAADSDDSARGFSEKTEDEEGNESLDRPWRLKADIEANLPLCTVIQLAIALYSLLVTDTAASSPIANRQSSNRCFVPQLGARLAQLNWALSH